MLNNWIILKNIQPICYKLENQDVLIFHRQTLFCNQFGAIFSSPNFIKSGICTFMQTVCSPPDFVYTYGNSDTFVFSNKNGRYLILMTNYPKFTFGTRGGFIFTVIFIIPLSRVYLLTHYKPSWRILMAQPAYIVSSHLISTWFSGGVFSSWQTPFEWPQDGIFNGLNVLNAAHRA